MKYCISNRSGMSSASSKKVEDPPTSSTGGFWTSLFGASTSAAAPTISTDPHQQDKDTIQEPPKPAVATANPALPSQKARNLLPPLPDPPNSFFMSSGGSFSNPPINHQFSDFKVVFVVFLGKLHPIGHRKIPTLPLKPQITV